MKNLRLYKFSFLLSFIFLLSSCGLDSMVSKFNTLEFKVTPKQVEVHGGNIEIELEVKIPEKYFQKTAEADFRAVLAKSNDSESKVFFDPIKLQGEKISSNGKTIGYVTGGSFIYKSSLKYNEKMADYSLFVTANASINKNSKNLGTIKVADGVMATSTRVKSDEVPALADHTYEKITVLEETATIYFTVNQSNVRYSQKSSEDIKRLKEFAKLGYETKNIEISSYASPEGSLDINDKVSDNRSESTFNYAKRLMKKLKIEGANNNDKYIKTSLGEDWAGFNSLVNTSNMKDKNKVLNIVRNQKDPQKREEAIRDMAEIYDAIEDDVLPKLRKATITLRLYEPKKNDEEIVSLVIDNPIQLDIKEMLYAATLIEDIALKKTIYNTIINAYPNDFRAYNNLATLYINEKNINMAIDMLGKASKLNENSNEVMENKGIIAAMEGDYSKARSLYNTSNASLVNKGILDIKTGDYSSASSKLKGNDYNSTLAKLMNGENPDETSDMTADGAYLNSIVHARNGDFDRSIRFLSKAIQMNPIYIKEAVKDFEFKKLSGNDRFQKLVN